jgi:hypothetical protein
MIKYATFQKEIVDNKCIDRYEHVVMPQGIICINFYFDLVQYNVTFYNLFMCIYSSHHTLEKNKKEKKL